jgi:hypothetical protein
MRKSSFEMLINRNMDDGTSTVVHHMTIQGYTLVESPDTGILNFDVDPDIDPDGTVFGQPGTVQGILNSGISMIRTNGETLDR